MNTDRLLCKAKGSENGEWVQGYYVYDYRHNNSTIMINTVGLYNAGFKPRRKDYGLEMVDIDPQTLCQCTGLKDKNGVLIFEGDVCRVSMGECYQGVWEYSAECEVRWCATGFDFVNKDGCGNGWGFAFDPEEIIILSNIHDKA